MAALSLRIDSLPSSTLGVVSVGPADSLEHAQSLMMSRDLSQLAVLTGPRSLRGAVSWESIAKARIRDPGASLMDAMQYPETVRGEDDLLAKIPVIRDTGFVFVAAADNTITGIVTTADLTQLLGRLGSQFLRLAEIEHRLRVLTDPAFARSVLAQVQQRTTDLRGVTFPADQLATGSYSRLNDGNDDSIRPHWAST